MLSALCKVCYGKLLVSTDKMSNFLLNADNSETKKKKQLTRRNIRKVINVGFLSITIMVLIHLNGFPVVAVQEHLRHVDFNSTVTTKMVQMQR